MVFQFAKHYYVFTGMYEPLLVERTRLLPWIQASSGLGWELSGIVAGGYEQGLCICRGLRQVAVGGRLGLGSGIFGGSGWLASALTTRFDVNAVLPQKDQNGVACQEDTHQRMSKMYVALCQNRNSWAMLCQMAIQIRRLPYCFPGSRSHNDDSGLILYMCT